MNLYSNFWKTSTQDGFWKYVATKPWWNEVGVFTSEGLKLRFGGILQAQKKQNMFEKVGCALENLAQSGLVRRRLMLLPSEKGPQHHQIAMIRCYRRFLG